MAPASIESVPTPSLPVPSALTSAASEIVARAGLDDGAGVDREVAGRFQVHVAVGADGIDPRNLDGRGAGGDAAYAGVGIVESGRA